MALVCTQVPKHLQLLDPQLLQERYEEKEDTQGPKNYTKSYIYVGLGPIIGGNMPIHRLLTANNRCMGIKIDSSQRVIDVCAFKNDYSLRVIDVCAYLFDYSLRTIDI
jgi:hypothetical protein